MVFDVYDIVFYQLLGFDPASSFLTGNFVHDLLYGIIIPVIFLFFIVDSFAAVMFRNKLRPLVVVAALGVIITGGWYPILAEITSRFFVVLLIISILIWFKTRIHGKGGIFTVSVDGEFLKGHMKWGGVKGDLDRAIRLALEKAILLEEVDRGLNRVNAVVYMNWQTEFDRNIQIAKQIIDKFGKRAKKEAKNILDNWERTPNNPALTPRLAGHANAARSVADRVRRRLGL